MRGLMHYFVITLTAKRSRARSRTRVQTSLSLPALGTALASVSPPARGDNRLTVTQAQRPVGTGAGTVSTPEAGSRHRGYSAPPETVPQSIFPTPPSAQFVLFAKMGFKLFISRSLADSTNGTAVTVSI